jgi:ABC-type multidrug transport system ATPase subunit
VQSLSPDILTLLHSPVYPLTSNQVPTIWPAVPPGLLVGPSSDPCSQRLATIMSADVKSVSTWVPSTAGWPSSLVNTTSDVATHLLATPGRFLGGITLKRSPGSASSSCGPLATPHAPSTLPSSWSFAIHLNGSFAPATFPGKLQVAFGDPQGNVATHAARNAFQRWQTSGAIAIQRWVESAILRLHGVPAPSAPIGNGFGSPPAPSRSMRLPLPNDQSTQTSEIELLFTPLMPLFSVSIFLGTFATRIVQERSRGIRSSLALMGLRTDAYWSATFGWYMALSALAAGGVTLASFIDNFTHISTPGFVYLFYLFYFMASLTFTSALSLTVDAAERAATVVGLFPIFSIVVWAPVILAGNSLSWLKGLVSFIGPHFALMAAFGEITLLERAGVGLNETTFVVGTQAVGSLAPWIALLGMAFNTLLWGTITVWWDTRTHAPSAASELGHSKAGAASPKLPTVEDFVPEKTLGVPLSSCVRVHNLSKVFSGTRNTSKDIVETYNDELSATDLGLAVVAPDAKGKKKRHPKGTVTFRPDRDLLAVAGVDMAFGPGQITCMLAPNGAGKSTTLNMMVGSVPATTGRVEFFNTVLTPSTVDSIRARIGVCPQHNVNFDELSAEEHLRLFAMVRGIGTRLKAEGTVAEAVDAEIKKRLEQVGLTGDDAVKPVATFSGGMRRKLAMAGALLGSPPILLLDEPTSGADPMTRRQIWDLILHQRDLGRCIVFTTHELSEAEALADRIVVMKRGRVVAGGGKLFLKTCFTDGYTVRLTHESDLGEALETTLRPFEGCKLHVARSGGPYKYRLSVPWELSRQLPDILDALHTLKPDMATLEQESLESVFLTIANQPEVPSDGKSRSDVEASSVAKAASSAQTVPARVVSQAAAASEVELTHVVAAEPAAASAPDAKEVVPYHAEEVVHASDDMEPIEIRAFGASISVWMQTKVMIWRRFLDLMREPSAVFWVVFFPLAYIIVAIVLLSTLLATSTVTPLPISLSNASLVPGQGLAWVSSHPPATRGFYAERVLMEQVACRATGGQPPSIPWKAAAAHNFTLSTATMGCAGQATVPDPTTGTMVVNGMIVRQYPSLQSLQTDALAIATTDVGLPVSTPYDRSLLPSGATLKQAQLLGTVQFASSSAFAPAFGGELPSCPNWPAMSTPCLGFPAAPQSNATLGFNSSVTVSQAILASVLSTATLRLGLGDPNATIEVTLAPLSFTSANTLVGFLASMFLGVAATNYLMTGGFELAQDRELQTRAKLQTMGLKSYFLALFSFDFMFAGIPLAVATIVAASLNTPVLGDSRLPAFVVSVIFFIPAGAMFAYIIATTLVSKLETAGAVIPMTMTFSGILPHLIAQSIETTSGLADGKAFRDALSFIPVFNFYNALNRLALLEFTNPPPPTGFELSTIFSIQDGVGYNLLWFVGIIAFEASVLWMLENGEMVFSVLCSDRYTPSEDVLAKDEATATPAARLDMEAHVKRTNEGERSRAMALRRVKGSVSAVSLTRDVRVSRSHRESSEARVTKRGGLMRRILDHWSIGVERGEVVALLGPAGAGKTTAMKLLVGEDTMTTRDATDDDACGLVHLNGIPREQARGMIGYCPQFDSLYPDISVDVHLHLFAGVRGIPVVDREPLFKALCDALDLTRHRSKTVKQLSGGNKRKLGLAIAVLGLPQVIVADEPSTGVDPAARRALWAVIAGSKAGSAQLVSTHSMDEAARLGDRIAIMVKGKLRAIGTANELKLQFGKGLLVDFETSDGAVRAKLEDTIMSGDDPLFEGASVLDRVGTVLRFSIPWEGGMDTKLPTLAKVYRSLEKVRESEPGLRYFSVSEPTLDEVFVQVVSASND